MVSGATCSCSEGLHTDLPHVTTYRAIAQPLITWPLGSFLDACAHILVKSSSVMDTPTEVNSFLICY